MKIIEITSRFTEYPEASALTAQEQELLQQAHTAAGMAYAPYSNFYVGAALMLDNGEICLGNNQENAAYPSGICAERVAIFAASATHPKARVTQMAVVAHAANRTLDHPISPCGACRQVLAEYEMKFKELDVLKVLEKVRGKEPSMACIKFFEAKYNNQTHEKIGIHPNYFYESASQIFRKDASLHFTDKYKTKNQKISYENKQPDE